CSSHADKESWHRVICLPQPLSPDGLLRLLPVPRPQLSLPVLPPLSRSTHPRPLKLNLSLLKTFPDQYWKPSIRPPTNRDLPPKAYHPNLFSYVSILPTPYHSLFTLSNSWVAFPDFYYPVIGNL